MPSALLLVCGYKAKTTLEVRELLSRSAEVLGPTCFVFSCQKMKAVNNGCTRTCNAFVTTQQKWRPVEIYFSSRRLNLFLLWFFWYLDCYPCGLLHSSSEFQVWGLWMPTPSKSACGLALCGNSCCFSSFLPIFLGSFFLLPAKSAWHLPVSGCPYAHTPFYRAD